MEIIFNERGSKVCGSSMHFSFPQFSALTSSAVYCKAVLNGCFSQEICINFCLPLQYRDSTGNTVENSSISQIPMHYLLSATAICSPVLNWELARWPVLASCCCCLPLEYYCLLWVPWECWLGERKGIQPTNTSCHLTMEVLLPTTGGRRQMATNTGSLGRWPLKERWW